MTKKHYSAPLAESTEALTACAFLEESTGASIPELDDSGIEIVW